MTDQITLHRLGDEDIEAVQLALYTALSWSNDPNIPGMETVMRHPEVGMYHQGWGRWETSACSTAIADGESAAASWMHWPT